MTSLRSALPLLCLLSLPAFAADPLPSWNEGQNAATSWQVLFVTGVQWEQA